MKTVVLAGGMGSRMGKAGLSMPKPVTLIGDRPAIWHVMRCLVESGGEFLVALGHHQYKVREHLQNHAERIESAHDCFASLVFRDGDVSWRADLIDTGENTQTAGRLRRLADRLNEPFVMTYSDGLSDVDIAEMTDFHRQHGRLVSMLAVRRPIRYGRLKIDGHNMVKEFVEKPVHSNEFINGGLFIVEPEVLSFIQQDSDSWEYDILPRVAEQHQLMAWQHDGFWQCMDYPHEVAELDALWRQGSAPWKKWNERY